MELVRSKTIKAAALICVACLAMVLGCKHQPTQPPAAVKHYPVSGEVMAKDVSSKQITLKHGDVPGFMGAMTMDYSLPDAATLDKLQTGDRIAAKIAVDPTDESKYWLEDVVVTAEPDHKSPADGTPPT
jgi:protein SCO1/2